MNRRDFLGLGSLAGLELLPGCAGPLARNGRRTVSPFPLLMVEGGPRERGRAHGESLRSAIHESVELWRASLSVPEGTSADDHLARFARETDFASAIARHTPELLDEMRGIAEGSGLPFETIYAMQMIDEEWCYAARKQWQEDGSAREERGDRCSVLALARAGRQPTFVAQNLDVPESLARHVVLVRHVERGRGLDALVLSMAGGIALNGVNAHGVAVCVNALLTLRSARSGLPVACVIRGALERADLAAAARFVQDVPHASGQCYTLGDPDGIACLEASAGKVAPAFGGAAALAHTNHPLANDDLGALGRWVSEQPAGSIPGMRNSTARLEACASRLAGEEDALARIRAALGSHDREDDPVCRHSAPDRTVTAASTIYELRAGRPMLHVAGNPPCMSEHHVHALESD